MKNYCFEAQSCVWSKSFASRVIFLFCYHHMERGMITWCGCLAHVLIERRIHGMHFFYLYFLHGTLSTPRLVVWRMKHAFDLSALQITCRIRLSSSHYNFSQQSGTLFKFVETEAFLRGLNKLKQSSLMSMLSSPIIVKLWIQ